MNNLLRAGRAALKLFNPKSWRSFIQVSEQTNFDHPINVSWSQAAEDLALYHAFKFSKEGTYLDIGCHHPSRFSVTRLLYQLGWSGVNVDANPELMKIFERERVRDVNICEIVGEEKEYTFSMFSESAISTANSEWKNEYVSDNQKLIGSITRIGMPLRKILEEYFPVHTLDLLSIDAEGVDFDIIKSLALETLSISKRPKWILLEANPPVKNASETLAVKYALNFGYEMHMVLPKSTLLKKSDV